AARSPRALHRRASKRSPVSPWHSASQRPGPAQANATGPQVWRTGVAGSSTPNASPTLADRSEARQRRAITVAKAMLVRSCAVKAADGAAPRAPGAGIGPKAEDAASGSATLARSVRIDEAGRHDLDLDIAVPHRIDRAHDLAMALRPMCDQAE